MYRYLAILLTLTLVADLCPAGNTLRQIEVKGSPSAIVLPENTSTPDGMTVASDGKIYLSMLNLHVPAIAAVWTIDADNRLRKLVDLPAHPETDGVYPLGIAQGADGHFYVADNQTFGEHTEHKSRLLRVVMDNGKAIRVETVATGFIASNAVEAFGDRIYVTETCLVNGATPHVSGLYKFELAELAADKPVELKPNGADQRLVAKITTNAADWRAGVGANGMAISPKGVLYVCNFGEASILTAPLGDDGFLAKPLELLGKGNGLESADGMKYVPAWNKLVVADFFSNAIHIVSTRNGRVKTIAQNPNSTGADGKLDKPSEPCVRGTSVYVSNIDLPYNGNESDKPDSLTVIELDISDN